MSTSSLRRRAQLGRRRGRRFFVTTFMVIAAIIIPRASSSRDVHIRKDIRHEPRQVQDSAFNQGRPLSCNLGMITFQTGGLAQEGDGIVFAMKSKDDDDNGVKITSLGFHVPAAKSQIVEFQVYALKQAGYYADSTRNSFNEGVSHDHRGKSQMDLWEMISSGTVQSSDLITSNTTNANDPDFYKIPFESFTTTEISPNGGVRSFYINTTLLYTDPMLDKDINDAQLLVGYNDPAAPDLLVGEGTSGFSDTMSLYKTREFVGKFFYETNCATKALIVQRRLQVFNPSTQPISSSPNKAPRKLQSFTAAPTITVKPTVIPTVIPTTKAPTRSPSASPSGAPTMAPTLGPSPRPSLSPSTSPSAQPSLTSSSQPSSSPNKAPSTSPSALPSLTSSSQPSQQPTADPCFADRAELKTAVDEYFVGGCGDAEDACPDLADKYGWPMGSWCVEKVTDMTELFKDLDTFNEDISGWEVGQVTTMHGMFWGATAFDGNLSSWDTSSVTSMQSMFDRASAFNGNISSWNTSAVTNMKLMFFQALSFNQDLSAWNTSAVTTMYGMFWGARNTAFDGNISSWDTSAVADMSNMFGGASKFNQDLSAWNTSAVTNMYGMFWGALAFDGNISSWDTSAVTDMSSMCHKQLGLY